MESIDILTGQNVTIAYKPASVFERGFATIIDWLIQLLFYFFVSYLWDEWILYYSLSSDLNAVLYAIFILAPIFLYNFMFEYFMHGQTPGKMLLKIRITNMDGSATSVGYHFLRWLIRPVDFFPFGGGVGMFFIFFSRRHQRVGDLAASTVVVKTGEKINIGAEYYEFDDTYEPIYPQVESLSDGQIDLIRKYLDLPEEGNENRVEDLALKVRKSLDVDARIPNRDFLVRVVKDYNYYASMGI